MRPALAAVFTLVAAAAVQAQYEDPDPSVTWIEPPDPGADEDTANYGSNHVYNLGDTEKLQWTTDGLNSSESISIRVCQVNMTSGYCLNDVAWQYVAQSLSSDTTSQFWVVALDYSRMEPLASSNVFSCVFYIEGEKSYLGQSHTFNISYTASTTSSITSTTSTSSSSTSSSTTTTTTTTPTPTTTYSKAADTGLSTGAKAGIGFGVGVVAVAVLGVMAGWFLVRRRGRGDSKVRVAGGGTAPAGGGDGGLIYNNAGGAAANAQDQSMAQITPGQGQGFQEYKPPPDSYSRPPARQELAG